MKMASRLLSAALSFAILLNIPFFQACGRMPEQTKLPVLSIETIRRDADVLDFVTEPVEPLVAEAPLALHLSTRNCIITLSGPEGKQPLEPCRARVKVRGNWSTKYPKKTLRIKFEKKRNLLGLNDGAKQKNWILLAEYKDVSMLRDKVALSLCREILEAHMRQGCLGTQLCDDCRGQRRAAE